MAVPPSSPSVPPAQPTLRGGFWVCGLGSLGQHCVTNLKTFGVRVNAVNLEHPDQWEIAATKVSHRYL